MKLIAAQMLATPGNIEHNIARHEQIIHLAASHGADVLLFPELSVTGYEPQLAQALAMSPMDERLDGFQALSDRHGMLIAVGVPTRGQQGIEISMVTFQPGQVRSAYSKQHLHADELAFFSAGTQPRVLHHAGVLLAPAICYESLQAGHAQQAAASGAQVYLASVAKSERGVAAANAHYPSIAWQHSMVVLMANCVGPSDTFIGAGQSAVWDAEGQRVGGANAAEEALLVYDTQSGQARVVRV